MLGVSVVKNIMSVKLRNFFNHRINFRAVFIILIAAALGGCSTFTRFDFPSFGLMSKEENTTASLENTERIYPPSDYRTRPYEDTGPEPVREYDESRTQSYSSNRDITRSELPDDVPSLRSRRFAAADPDYTQSPPARSRFSDAPANYNFGSQSNTVSNGTNSVTVQPGDTLYRLSRRYGVSVSDIQATNNLSGTDIRVGQRLFINGTGASGFSEPRRRATPARATAPRRVTPNFQVEQPTNLGNNTVVPRNSQDASSVRQTQQAQEPEPRAQQFAALPQKPEARQDPVVMPKTSGRFRWPVRGRIISKFGVKGNGVRNDGINISVPEGTEVKAAESGVVAYAGNELRGYGNLVLIRHANSWVSAYAHNSQILVKRGQRIRRGQVIAKVGKTGSVTQPQLHFELRRDAKPVDPLKHM